MNETGSTEDTLVVLTLALARRQQEEEDKLEKGESLSGAWPRPLSNETPIDSPLERDRPAEQPLDAEDTLPFPMLISTVG